LKHAAGLQNVVNTDSCSFVVTAVATHIVFWPEVCLRIEDNPAPESYQDYLRFTVREIEKISRKLISDPLPLKILKLGRKKKPRNLIEFVATMVNTGINKHYERNNSRTTDRELLQADGIFPVAVRE
jgi:hypothetical protein